MEYTTQGNEEQKIKAFLEDLRSQYSSKVYQVAKLIVKNFNSDKDVEFRRLQTVLSKLSPEERGVFEDANKSEAVYTTALDLYKDYVLFTNVLDKTGEDHLLLQRQNELLQQEGVPTLSLQDYSMFQNELKQDFEAWSQTTRDLNTKDDSNLRGINTEDQTWPVYCIDMFGKKLEKGDIVELVQDYSKIAEAFERFVTAAAYKKEYDFAIISNSGEVLAAVTVGVLPDNSWEIEDGDGISSFYKMLYYNSFKADQGSVQGLNKYIITIKQLLGGSEYSLVRGEPGEYVNSVVDENLSGYSEEEEPNKYYDEYVETEEGTTEDRPPLENEYDEEVAQPDLVSSDSEQMNVMKNFLQSAVGGSGIIGETVGYGERAYLGEKATVIAVRNLDTNEIVVVPQEQVIKLEEGMGQVNRTAADQGFNTFQDNSQVEVLDPETGEIDEVKKTTDPQTGNAVLVDEETNTARKVDPSNPDTSPIPIDNSNS